MRPAEEIKRLIANLSDTTSARMDQRVRQDMLRALAESEETPALGWPSVRRTIMKSPITKLAAAAAILVAALTAAHYIGGPIDVASPVLAEVVGQIHKARSVIYKETFYAGESREFTNTEMITESGINRSELPDGDILIFDLNSGTTLHLMPNSTRAIVTFRVGRSKGNRLFNYLDWVSNLHEEGGVFTGRQKLDGVVTNVFVVEMPFEVTTVWVDPKTNLPVRVEMLSWSNPDKDIMVPEMSLSLKDFGGEAGEARSIIISSGRGSPDGIQKKMKRVLSDFSWNVQPNESLFSLEPPEGYTVEKRQFDDSELGEHSLVQALSFWTEMSDGIFPSRINDLGDPNLLQPLLIAKFDKEGDPAEELNQAMKQMHVILKGLFFAQECKAEGSWHYAGEGVRVSDATAPVCWWKPRGSENYRVIHADLSIGDLSAEDALERQ